MSKFALEKLPDEPIVVGTLAEGFDMEVDFEEMDKTFKALINSLEEPVYYIGDVRHLKMTIPMMIKSASQMSKVFKHPNIINSVMVVEGNPLLKAASEGLRSDVFGNVAVLIFDTVDEALEYVRAKLAKKKKAG